MGSNAIIQVTVILGMVLLVASGSSKLSNSVYIKRALSGGSKHFDSSEENHSSQPQQQKQPAQKSMPPVPVPLIRHSTPPKLAATTTPPPAPSVANKRQVPYVGPCPGPHDGCIKPCYGLVEKTVYSCLPKKTLVQLLKRGGIEVASRDCGPQLIDAPMPLRISGIDPVEAGIVAPGYK